MDFNHNQTQQQSRPESEPIIPVNSSKKKKRNLKLSRNGLVSGLLALIVVILIVFGLLWYFRGAGSNESSQINKNEYQAIFLSNGQVYFGNLDTLTNTYFKLTDIYYLQAKQTVQPKQGDTASQPSNVQLVKLGQELHGPEDAMQINRDQVVFWENLKKSGKVTQAIIQYQKNGSNSNSSSPSSTSVPTSSGSNSTPSSSGGAPASSTPSSSGAPSTSSGGTPSAPSSNTPSKKP